MRIIYVEDNLANVGLIERICKMNNDQLETYRNGESAITAIDVGQAELFLVDMHLGKNGMDGLELVRQLRKKGVKAPIVAMTAYDALGYGKEYESAGCNDYVRKPIDVRALLRLIDSYREATVTESNQDTVKQTTDETNNVDTTQDTKDDSMNETHAETNQQTSNQPKQKPNIGA